MKKIKIIKGHITQRDGDKILIFDAEKSLLYTFNGTATFIFDRMKKGVDLKKIVEGLTEEFSVTHDQAKKDAYEFARTLIAKGLAKEEK